jgi:predicted RNA methylase
MKYNNIREEELKNKIAQDYFVFYDCTKIIGNIDFCVTIRENKTTPSEQEFLLWAEAKIGSSDIVRSLVQLILTIGKARTFDKFLPPPMLGAFDGEKIAFIPYNEIHDIFYQNDFNWNVTPSDYSTKEFQQIHAKVKTTIDSEFLLFNYEKDHKDLHQFIKQNFVVGKLGLTKTKIDKTNFMVIYNKWLQTVKPSIAVNWDIAKKNGIIDGDFYLADLLSQENHTLKEKLFVLLKGTHYELDRKIDESGLFSHSSASFNDKQIAHTQFWNRYERPPKQEYWDYIVKRRDLLVPQDVRERKGSFFTPQIWVELSQKYLTDVLGEDWQDEYTVWDCAAGTGNLLTGLTNKYNIWASTLDRQDVEVMRDRIKNGANLLESHVFQFDFLNDEFTKLPAGLQAIINDPEKRKKLLIYINPPYAEADNRRGDGRSGVAESVIHKRYAEKMGYTKRELYIQFLTRIYCEISGCMLADFSKLKNLQAPKFLEFRAFFKAKLLKCFLVPANTFDNVKGNFPIGFKIWDTDKNEAFEHILADLYGEKGVYLGVKNLWAYEHSKFINDWIKPYRKTASESIATIIGVGSDFQNQRLVRIERPNMKVPADNHHWQISKDNLIESSIYFAVRHSIEATWLNDRDQFLYPNDGWQTDMEFQNDCLAYTLFNNNIQSQFGINHWIPFTESEINARDKFASNFMTKFMQGKLKSEASKQIALKGHDLPLKIRTTPLKFSPEAEAVFKSGRELWTYYHQQHNANVNASLYDIRAHFQGRNDRGKGKMNNKSGDEKYMNLIKTLRKNIKQLQTKIAPKVFEYSFLK